MEGLRSTVGSQIGEGRTFRNLIPVEEMKRFYA